MPRGEVLVAIVNNLEDMRLAREEGWYRIPVASVRKWLGDCWPPDWLAFYQTKVFGPEAYAIKYYAVVRDIRMVSRMDLFPDTSRNHPKANRRYHQLLLGDLQRLPKPNTREWNLMLVVPPYPLSHWDVPRLFSVPFPCFAFQTCASCFSA